MTVAYGALFGLAFGSFVNAVIDRVPGRHSLRGRSQCDACGRRLRAPELVPLLSFALLRGRCRGCAAPIGLRTPVVEALFAAFFAAAFALLPLVAAAAACAAFATLAAVAGVARRKRDVAR